MDCAPEWEGREENTENAPNPLEYFTRKGLKQLYQDQLLCDATIVAEGKRFPCHRFLVKNVAIENCLVYYALAYAHNDQALLGVAMNLVTTNFGHLSKEEDDFLHLDLSTLVSIISLDGLVVASELVIYQAVKRWVRFQTTERSLLIGELMKHIRFPLLSQDDVREVQSDWEHCLDVQMWQKKLDSIDGPFDSRALRQGMYDKCIVCVSLSRWISKWMENEEFHVCYFDPRKENWEKLPALNCLYSPACVAVGDKLYVSGGTLRDKSHSAALHKYDFFKGRWLHLPPMSVPRASHGFLACNQKLYALGGCCGFEDYLDSAECFDLMEKTWTPISRLPFALSCSASAALKDKLYLIGGERNYLFPEMYKGVLIYDINSGIWTQVPLAVECCSAGAVPMNNGIYVIGGYAKERMRHLPVRSPSPGVICGSALCFFISEDGRMDEDVFVPELPRGIAGAGVVQWERRIYVLGGENCWVYTNPNVHNESPGTYYDTIYFWEPSDLTWTECPENLPIIADGVSGFGCVTMKIPKKHILALLS
ncbi:hypothetical protein KIL84_021335 [Mauremys mutica]|uniref:BACK domain-containing protein n=1 Tax=Mauremys mutica TaxID=74926 RepID=A0A9D3WPT4_9SAUR|nr:hypothetical protein KIL84_021335 [Mauremys mutica]